ncbi:MAG TPA: PilZ domain-containing protein [Firmicutes bacterium]|nr:PilZ domain-containing protein [Bacillota bacterium]
MDFLERRKHKRVPKAFDVDCRIISPEVQMEMAGALGNETTVKTLDISEGGIGVYGTEELKPNQMLALSIRIDDTEEVKAYAEVKWVYFDKTTGKFKAGLEFMAIKAEDREYIRKINS